MTKEEKEIKMFEIHNRFSLYRKAINGVVIGTVSCFLWLMIRELAGKVTAAQFVVNLFASHPFAWMCAIIFGGGGITYGTVQKRLRHDVTKRMSSRNMELEKKLDPERSGSGLTPHGETPEGEEE